jgi:hypothetical protein
MNKTEDTLLILALLGGAGFFGYTLWKKGRQQPVHRGGYGPGGTPIGGVYPTICQYATNAFCNDHPGDACCAGGTGVPDCAYASVDYCSTYGHGDDPCCRKYGPAPSAASAGVKTGYPGPGAAVVS